MLASYGIQARCVRPLIRSLHTGCGGTSGLGLGARPLRAVGPIAGKPRLAIHAGTPSTGAPGSKWGLVRWASKGTRRPKKRTGGRNLGIAVFGAIVAGAVGAGVWQQRRYRWKVELIEAVEARLNAPVVTVTSELDAQELYMRRIKLTGRFLHEHEVFVGPRSPSPDASHENTNGEKSGFMVFTPFVTNEGVQVIVNRGWVPRRSGRGDAVQRPTGEVEMLAVVREHEARKSSIMPDNDMATGQVFWADVPLFSRRAGFKDPENCALVDLVEPWQPGQFPLPRGMKSYTRFYVTPFKHVVYSTTWYSLAVAGTIMTFIKFRRGGR